MTAIDSAMAGFRKIILGGVPTLLKENDTAFLAFICMVAAIDSLAAYRYDINGNCSVKKRPGVPTNIPSRRSGVRIETCPTA